MFLLLGLSRWRQREFWFKGRYRDHCSTVLWQYVDILRQILFNLIWDKSEVSGVGHGKRARKEGMAIRFPRNRQNMCCIESLSDDKKIQSMHCQPFSHKLGSQRRFTPNVIFTSLGLHFSVSISCSICKLKSFKVFLASIKNSTCFSTLRTEISSSASGELCSCQASGTI